MRRLMCQGVITLLVVSGFAAASRSQEAVNPTGPQAQSRLNASVGQAEQNLLNTTSRFEAGVASINEVQNVQIELAEARIQLAALEQKPNIAIENLETIVTHRERLWAVATEQYKAGMSSADARNTARIKLAQARIRLESAILLAMQEENARLVEQRYKHGLVSRSDVEAAQKALDEFRNRLSREQ